MKVFLVVLLATLTAVLGTVAPATVYAEPAMPVEAEACVASADADAVHYNRPQTRGWFEEVTGYGSFCPPTFAEALAELDSYWDAEAAKNCSLHGCQPRFGGVIHQGSCDRTAFRSGDVIWGGWYNPEDIPEGMEPLLLEEVDGWSGVYRVTVDGFHIPESASSQCAGGRWLRELQYGFLPLILR